MLPIELPIAYEERIPMMQEWALRSETYALFFGCLTAIDGWIYTLQNPEYDSNPRDYFSGNYQKFGVHVQAVGDANLKFTYVAVAATGVTNNG